uniref:Uncharacterized protein n=1 Tax=Rhizophora mucronata TaxID=61149 RepID=A0A2P2QIM3_RHIMU
MSNESYITHLKRNMFMFCQFTNSIMKRIHTYFLEQ